MLITKEEFQSFSGNYDSDNWESYVSSAKSMIETYIGFDPETNEDWKQTITLTIFVYSEDNVHYFSDAELTNPVEVPEGAELNPGLEENQFWYSVEQDIIAVPELIKIVCKEIATLLQLEENQNIGVNNKSFGESGTRTFLNVTNFDPYLKKLSRYKKGGALKF